MQGLFPNFFVECYSRKNTVQFIADLCISLWKNQAIKYILLMCMSQAHDEALKGEWQNFLNLCICQENHLKNAEEYKKVRSVNANVHNEI